MRGRLDLQCGPCRRLQRNYSRHVGKGATPPAAASPCQPGSRISGGLLGAVRWSGGFGEYLEKRCLRITPYGQGRWLVHHEKTIHTVGPDRAAALLTFLSVGWACHELVAASILIPSTGHDGRELLKRVFLALRRWKALPSKTKTCVGLFGGWGVNDKYLELLPSHKSQLTFVFISRP